MNITKLYKDYNIPTAPEEHKHSRPGWLNTECPFCTGNPGYHLGYNFEGSKFFCWRCGSKRKDQAIAKLLHISISEAISIIKKYKGIPDTTPKKPSKKIGQKEFILPSGLVRLQPNHKAYLESRGFDPDFLSKHWHVLGLNPVATLDKMRLNNRIFIPIYWNKQMVSFQTRSISKSKTDEIRYISCPKEREIIHHKHILYGNPIKWEILRTVIVVEGVTDVWKLGDYAVSTLGIQYKREQIKQLVKNFDRFIIIFDSEPQAQEMASKLKETLSFFGKEAWVETIDGDPGALAQDDANHLVNNIMKQIY
ncbi:MAG: toprim domain-containing protein [bacterium]